MARKGTRLLAEDATERREPNANRTPTRAGNAAKQRPPDEIWIFDGIVEDDAPSNRSRGGRATRRGPGSGAVVGTDDIDLDGGAATARPRPRRDRQEELPSDVVAEIAGAAGRERAAKVSERLAAAASAYRRDRYPEALRITKPLVDQVPNSASAQELHGLVCYRMGRWRQAIAHLTAASELAGQDPSQLPVLMDCHRAQGHHRRVRELWDTLRSASPSADILAEGRLVLAADLAERDDLAGAIKVLTDAGAGRDLRHPQDRHVRQWYVLGDLSEREGDRPRARELFARAVKADPELADARERLAALGMPPAGRPVRARGKRGQTITLGELAKQSGARPSPGVRSG